MYTSELVAELQEHMDRHGDFFVCFDINSYPEGSRSEIVFRIEYYIDKQQVDNKLAIFVLDLDT